MPQLKAPQLKRWTLPERYAPLQLVTHTTCNARLGVGVECLGLPVSSQAGITQHDQQCGIMLLSAALMVSSNGYMLQGLLLQQHSTLLQVLNGVEWS